MAVFEENGHKMAAIFEKMKMFKTRSESFEIFIFSSPGHNLVSIGEEFYAKHDEREEAKEFDEFAVGVYHAVDRGRSW